MEVYIQKAVGIKDEPVVPGGSDNLDLTIHTKSLIRFINDTSTPITIGIQGEWGSGKTSLINAIYHSFESNAECKQIWINSWEYSLLSTPEESLLKIVNRIIDELIEADKNQKRKEKIQDGAKKIFQGALRVGAQLTLGNEAANVAGELLSSGEANIGALREQLKELVEEIERRTSNPYKKIIIYVDDLDRIEPKNAVAILELLKNIFSVPNCVFILAIDYQVVVKGLEHKFGKQTAENEWEFRAFFDKIIQLPFMMPMGQYNIGKYVNSLLMDIGFVTDDGLNEESIREIILRTIGGNPRSIKRLVNSVSLIQIFSEEKVVVESSTNEQEKGEEELDERDYKFLMFSLLCLQIAYPQIYSLLITKPDFSAWDDDFAFEETKRSEESSKTFSEEYENAIKTSDFNEDWEKCLYRICFNRPRLKPRVADISKFFSYIKDELMANKQEIIGETIASVMSQTSVTSVTSTDQGQIILPERQGAYKRRFLDGLDTWILDKQTNDGYSDDQINLIKQIHIDLEKELEAIEEFLYAGTITGYVASRKFCNFGAKFGKNGCVIRLVKHFDNNYRVPLLKNIVSAQNRKFSLDKPSTAHNSHMYALSLKDADAYKINKHKILTLFKKSIEMVEHHWDSRLNIDNRKKVVTAKDIEIRGESQEYNEITQTYLGENYTYEA